MKTAAVLWTALAAAIGVRVAGRAADDFFITYRYAWNLVHGHGFVFNPGERVFGLTDPGLGLLLAALHALTRLPVPLLGTAVTGASLVGIALLLLAEGIERELRTEALVGGTLLAGSSWMWANQGAGAFAALFLLLLAARLAGQRPGLAGIAAGVAVWMRPDALAGIGLLGLLLAGERRILPWRYAAIGLLMVCAGAGAAWLWFGSVLPNTLGAKAAGLAGAPEAAGLAGFWARALTVLPRHWGPWWAAVAAVGIAGLVPLFAASGRAGRLLVLYGAALAVAYPLLGVPFASWYTVPTAAAVLYGVPALVLGLGRLPALRSRRLLAGAAALAVLLSVLVSLLPATWEWYRAFVWQRRLETYRQAGLWLREHSAPDEAIAYVEVGVIAYTSRRPVIDLLGLVTPEVVPYVRAKDLPGAFLARPAPWVIHHTRGRMGSLIRRHWFQKAYREAAHIDEPGGGRLTVYHRRHGAKLPHPQPPRKRAL